MHNDPYRATESDTASVDVNSWPAVRGLGRVLLAVAKFIGRVMSAAWTDRNDVARATRTFMWWLALPLTIVLYGLRRAGGAYDEPRARCPQGHPISDGPERVMDFMSIDSPFPMLITIFLVLTYVALLARVVGSY